MDATIKARQYIARQLVRLAYKVYKESPEVQKFWLDLIREQAILGKSIIRTDPREMYTEDS